MNEKSGINPDVLSCLANLSNDEVITSPKVVNDMLDCLPEEIWSNPKATFLDPSCKSGVFLREIAKRLISGLKDQYPDIQERVNHICKKQLYGIAITELTGLMSRRSVYCSKIANGEFSICSDFKTSNGNIIYISKKHTWVNGKCSFCGAGQDLFDRPDDLESHAYLFTHIKNPEEIFNMKFDVIIGNPPYQLDTGGSGRQAKPIYPQFIEQAMKLNPRYLSMIIPSRWFAGGMGLEQFREKMLSDRHIRVLVDYANGKECFPGNSVSGGVNYFLWDRDEEGDCKVVNASGDTFIELTRPLDEFPTLVRYNQAIGMLRKIKKFNEKSLQDVVSSISPFALVTKIRGLSEKTAECSVPMYSSAGLSYISPREIYKGREYFDHYKVMISQTSAEHAGEPGKDGKFRVISSSIRVLAPGEVCTHSYLVMGPYDTKEECENLVKYLKTKFARFLILQSLTSIHLTKNTFYFVPEQDFSKSWSDDELYSKYGLDSTEIDFINSMIKDYEEYGE